MIAEDSQRILLKMLRDHESGSCGRALSLPPAEHAHRPQSYPARRLSRSVVHLEPDPARHAPVEGPVAVHQASGTNVVNRLAEPGVGLGAGQGGGRPEVVQRSEDVVAPAVGMQKGQELFVGWFAAAETTEKAALEQVFLA